MILIISTAEENKIIIGLFENKAKTFWHEQRVLPHESEKLLVYIDKILKKKRKKLTDLRGVIVVLGPGGFTSIRIGVICANTLAFALKISVVGIKKTEYKDKKDLVRKGLIRLDKSPREMVLPFYGKPPNITKPKKILA